MQAIWKYPVTPGDAFTLSLPEYPVILDVQLQHGEPVLWALVDTEAPHVPVRFLLIPTGVAFEDNERLDLSYVGTFQLDGGALVFHLFEVCDALEEVNLW